MHYRLRYRSGFSAVIVLAFFLWVPVAHSQSLKRQAIVSNGSSSTLEGITLQASVGQSSPTESSYHGLAGIRSGFIQPFSSFMERNHLGIQDLRIYPNPANAHFKIDFPVLRDDIINILDLSGKLVISFRAGDLLHQALIDISACPPGVYCVQLIRDQSLIGSVKMIKS